MSDSAPAIFGSLSIAVVTYSACYTLGYFGSVDMRYLYYLSPSDYLSSFLSDIPTFAIFFGGGFLVKLILASVWRANRPTQSKKQMSRHVVIVNVVSAVLALIAAGVLVAFKMPWGLVAVPLLMTIIFLDDLYTEFHERFAFDHRVISWMLFASMIGVLVFLDGNSDGMRRHLCLKPDANLILDNGTQHGCIFWMASDGVLFSQGAAKPLIFYPKARLREIQNLVDR